jgi:hypothetical protein
MIINKKESPKEGKTALTQQIYRGKGNLRECSNYRHLRDWLKQVGKVHPCTGTEALYRP